VVLASIFAAIMSTADSQLLVAASSVVRDIYDKIIRKGDEIPQKRLVLMSRLVVLVLVLVSLVFGYLAEDLVFWLVLFAWAGLGASIGPASIMALYWKGTTRTGVMAGMVAGTGVTIGWYFTPLLSDLMYELVPGFIAGLAVTWLVSLYTEPAPDTEQAFGDMFDKG
jgi:Na+/proline symporter